MAVAGSTGTTTDAFATILNLDGSLLQTAVRARGSVKNTGGQNGLLMRITLTNARSETQAVTTQLDPSNTSSIDPDTLDLAIGGPFLIVNVAVISEVPGAATTYDLKYTTW